MSAERERLTGRILNDRYYVLEQIGTGGSGNLYLARDMSLGTMWAVKEIPAGKRMEAKILTRLSHPCLPRMVDYAEADGHCCLIMEYIRGSSLEQLRREGYPFRAGEIKDYAVRILDILIYLHSQKPPILYGDLKPANLMLSREGRLYLVDFGSAVRGYEDSSPKPCEGTPGYAAPEQYRGHISARSDLYALGKTLLALIKGTGTLFSFPSLLFFVKNPGLTFFLHKCIQEKENTRYPDAASARKTLLRILRSERILVFAGAGGAGALLLILVLLILPPLKTVPFESDFPEQGTAFPEALTQATSSFYDDSGFSFSKPFSSFSLSSVRHPESLESYLDESKPEQVWIRETESRLKQMLSRFRQEKEVSTLLMLLAKVSESEGAYQQAAGYYEQLLLYQPENRQALASYGLFLLRSGQKKNSLRLWENFRTAQLQGADHAVLRDELLWARRLGIKTGKKKGSEDIEDIEDVEDIENSGMSAEEKRRHS